MRQLYRGGASPTSTFASSLDADALVGAFNADAGVGTAVYDGALSEEITRLRLRINSAS